MKVGTTAETNERKDRRIFAIILITISFAIIFSILFQQLVILFTWFIKLIIKHWVKILIGIVVILLARRILFRGKRR